ncbi:MAG: CBS domain-containing protein [Ottowia sp.]
MATVADVLKNKRPGELAILPPEATVRDALQLMADRDIGSVVVIGGELLEGIFTERDYARRIVLKGLHSVDVKLIDVMTKRLYVVHLDDTVQECLSIMTQARVRHLPVVADKRITGLVSIGDLVNHMLEEQRFMIEQLENYIAGNMG